MSLSSLRADRHAAYTVISPTHTNHNNYRYFSSILTVAACMRRDLQHVVGADATASFLCYLSRNFWTVQNVEWLHMLMPEESSFVVNARAREWSPVTNYMRQLDYEISWEDNRCHFTATAGGGTCFDGRLLWPPCVADAGHYIFVLWFLLSSSTSFPRLISAVTDWMSTILPHMVWS